MKSAHLRLAASIAACSFMPGCFTMIVSSHVGAPEASSAPPQVAIPVTHLAALRCGDAYYLEVQYEDGLVRHVAWTPGASVGAQDEPHFGDPGSDAAEASCPDPWHEPVPVPPDAEAPDAAADHDGLRWNGAVVVAYGDGRPLGNVCLRRSRPGPPVEPDRRGRLVRGLLLPFAVLADVATAPLQLVVLVGWLAVWTLGGGQL